MTVDLSKVATISTYNSFKNDNQQFTGTITTPSSLTANQTITTTQTISLSEAPQFSKFYSRFQEVGDMQWQFNGLSGFNGIEWYPANVSGIGAVGVMVTTAPFAAAIGAFIYVVIVGSTALVRFKITNPYSSTVSLTVQSIPWTFIEYTLAS